MKKDVTLYLQTRNGGYWVANTHHNGWEILETFVWDKSHSENGLIQWLERLITEEKIDVGDAIRVGIYAAKY